ncbi:unnamed protein product, partial [Didymodactylos carnosus]
PDANKCHARGCTWNTEISTNIPICYIPKWKGGYELVVGQEKITQWDIQYKLRRLFGNDIDNLKLKITRSGTNIIRLKILDDDRERYEVPVPIKWYPSNVEQQQQKIKFQLTKTKYNQIGFQIVRVDTKALLFDTSYFAEGFIYDDKYVQFITTIPSKNIYGIFARDQRPVGLNENLYGTHPFYMVIENDGNAFGVFIFNSNAQDYKFSLFEPDKSMLTYRTVDGILDLFFFAGPTPEDVVRQYQQVIGTPYIPPYWGLGFQLGRYGYNTLDNMRAAMNRFYQFIT